jgi:trigger factor
LENIKVAVEEPSSVKRKITVEVPVEEVDRYFRETLKEYQRHAALPGFRKGKAPREMVESRFRDDINQDVTRKILPDSYEKALGEAELMPIGDPEVSELKVEPGQPVSYVAEFEIFPRFEVENYLGIELEKPVFEVKDEEVDGLLEEMRAGQATVKQVAEERGLRTGDVAMIDFEGVSDGKPIPGGSAKDFPLTIGSETFLPGFEESLVGARAGEEREFFLKLPEDFQEKDLAGKEASFKATVKEIRERVLPELDDDFAKDVGDYGTLEELKARIRTNLLASKEVSSQGEMREKLVGRLVEAHSFEVPPSMVEERRSMMMANVERSLLMRGVPQEEIGKSREKFYEESAGPAERKVRASLIMAAIAEKEKIEVSPEEINAEIKRIAEQNKMEPSEARKRMIENRSLENLKGILGEEKTVSFLLEKARITGGGKDAAPAQANEEKGKEEQ